MTQIRFDGCDLSPRGARTPRYGRERIGLALAAASAALLLLAAGCGGSGRMSKADYTRAVNDDGRKLSALFGSVDQGTRNLHQFAVRIGRGRAALDGVRADLKALKPPKAAENAHGKLLIALDTLSDDLAGLQRAATSGNENAVLQARARLAAPGRQLISAIQQLQQAGFAINSG
jgi:hypothetical protein